MIIPARTVTRPRTMERLSRLVGIHGAPRHLRCDNGPEFASKALISWMHDNNVQTAFTAPGKPWRNGVDESFNGTFRNECLNAEWFRNAFEAKVMIAAWECHYNQVRPHSNLGYLTPHEFKQLQPRTNNQNEASSL